MTLPFVSVVVPHYHDLAGLADCLRSLDRQTYPRDRFEIVVSDNASPEGQAAIEEVLGGRARLVIAVEKGAGPARNVGVAAARGEVLAFTDADCQPEPGWLAAGVAALSTCDFAGGAMRVLVRAGLPMTGPEAFESVFAFDNAAYVRGKGFTVTANLFCPRSIFEAVGPFRAGVSEDLEWSFRAREVGFCIGYAADAIVGHPARRTWPELLAKWHRLTAETLELYRARPAGRLVWLARSLCLPLSAVVHTPRVLTSPRLSGAADRISALAALYRLRFWRCGEGLRLLVRTKPN